MKTASNKLRVGKHQSLISFTSPKQCTHCVLDKKVFSKNISDPFNMNPKFMKFSMFIYKIRWCVSIQKVSPHFCQDPDKTTTAAWLQPLHFLNTTILKYIVYNWKTYEIVLQSSGLGVLTSFSTWFHSSSFRNFKFSKSLIPNSLEIVGQFVMPTLLSKADSLTPTA